MKDTHLAHAFSAAVAALCVLTAATAGAVEANDATRILQGMRGAIEPAKDMRAELDVEMTNTDGESVHWTGKLYRRGGTDARMRLVFESPLDLRGTEVATSRTVDGMNHTRIYLPALRRVRDLEGDARGEAFLGTDFNYEDIGLESLRPEESDVHGEDKIDGRACYRLSSRPGHGWWYGRILRFVDEKTSLPLRTEYYDRSDTLWKIRTFGGVKSIDGIPTATDITMRTVPTGTTTKLTLTDVHYDRRLSDKIFEIP